MQIVAQWGGIGALAVATGPSLGAAIVSAGGWRWAFFVNLPVGLFVLIAGRRGADRIAAGRARPARPTTSASSSCRCRWRRSCWPSRRVRRGAGPTAASSARWPWRSSAARCSCTAPGTTTTRSSTRPCSRAARSCSPTAPPSSTPPASSPCCSATSCSSPACGTTRSCAAGLAVTPGPIVVAIIAGPAGKLAARIGFRPVLLFGATCFALGLVQLHPAASSPRPTTSARGCPARCSSASASASRSRC